MIDKDMIAQDIIFNEKDVDITEALERAKNIEDDINKLCYDENYGEIDSYLIME